MAYTVVFHCPSGQAIIDVGHSLLYAATYITVDAGHTNIAHVSVLNYAKDASIRTYASYP